jgi:exodeoxyribonuclease V beta subunit
VGRAVDEAMAHEGLVVDRHELVTGICTAVATPLGPIASGRALRDLAPADRLDELDFQLPLGGAGRPADDAAVGRLVLEHLPPEHPLRPWAASLAGGRFGAVLAGNLVGSIDAVLRIRDEGTADRFLVVDYKTNTLGRHDRAPDLADYHPDRLPAAMAGHHYPLQALLYSVALHRYLRWRLPAYDPAHHLGGIAYLFLRGMAGPHAPTVEGAPHGVFAWRPDASLVDALSDLLDGGEDRP